MDGVRACVALAFGRSWGSCCVLSRTVQAQRFGIVRWYNVCYTPMERSVTASYAGVQKKIAGREGLVCCLASSSPLSCQLGHERALFGLYRIYFFYMIFVALAARNSRCCVDMAMITLSSTLLLCALGVRTQLLVVLVHVLR